MISEKMMEEVIISNPEKYIGEKGLRLLAFQFRIGSYIFDLLFEDRHGGKLIIELQKGTLDRSHTYKVLDYYDEYKNANPREFIDLMVIANNIPSERKQRLSALGIAFREIPISDFIDDFEVINSAKHSHISDEASTLSKEGTKIDEETFSSYKLFKGQKNEFSKALKEYDRSIKIMMDWKDLSDHNIRHKQNWSFWFIPSTWEISSSQFSGVHFGLIYFMDKNIKSEFVRFSVGVEKPVTDLYKKQFKEEVVKELHLRKIELSDFDLWPSAGVTRDKVKLLEVKIPLNNDSWKKAIEYYKKLGPFINIVSDKIEEFNKRGYFK